MERKITEAEKAAKGLVVLIALGAIIVFGLKSCFGVSDKSSAPKAELTSAQILSKRKVNAYIQSQMCVEGILKAPSTAKFPYGDCDLIPQINDSTFLVISYVDAQNAYGAMVRNYYRCVIVENAESKFECLETRFIPNPDSKQK